MSKPRKPCAGCGKKTTIPHPVLSVHCCAKCQWRNPDYQTINASCATEWTGIDPIDLVCLRHTAYPPPQCGDRWWSENPKLSALGIHPANIYLEKHVKEAALAAGKTLRLPVRQIA